MRTTSSRTLKSTLLILLIIFAVSLAPHQFALQIEGQANPQKSASPPRTQPTPDQCPHGPTVRLTVRATTVDQPSGLSAESLSKEGPQFPTEFSMSNFTATCFVAGNWPLFIDYELEQSGRVTLTVAAEGVAPFIYRLRETRVGRHEELITLPTYFGGKPRVATYSIKAVSEDTAYVKPVPHLLIYAFGGGHNAVSSSGIDQVSFQPGSVLVSQNQRATYRFHSRRDFNKVSADFMRIGKNPDNEIVAQLVDRKKFDKGMRRDDVISDVWNCKAGGRASQGSHELHVRAWRGLESGGDWMFTSSAPQWVRVQ